MNSIYREMYKPSPLSNPPKRETKLLTLGEVLELARGMSKQERQAALSEWMKTLPELPHGLLAARPDLLDNQPDPRNYNGANWSEVG